MSPGLIGQDIPIAEVAVMAGAWEMGSTYLADEWVIPTYNKWMGEL